MNSTTRGIALRRRNFGEADRLITFLTYELGKVTVRARGVRKPLSKLGGHIELFAESKITLAEGRNWYTLTEAQTVIAHSKIRSDLAKTSAAYLIAEIIDRIIQDNERLPHIYDLAAKTFELLDKSDNTLVVPAFIWNIATGSGYGAELFRCVVCQEKILPEEVFFSISLGGVLDKKHVHEAIDAVKISSDTIKIMRMVVKDIAFVVRINIPSTVRQEFRQIVWSYSEKIIEHKPKSMSFLEEVYENMDRN